jgi:hypothetical protein
MSFTQKTEEEHGENSIKESLVICTHQQNSPGDANKEEKMVGSAAPIRIFVKKFANEKTRKN